MRSLQRKNFLENLHLFSQEQVTQQLVYLELMSWPHSSPPPFAILNQRSLPQTDIPLAPCHQRQFSFQCFVVCVAILLAGVELRVRVVAFPRLADNSSPSSDAVVVQILSRVLAFLRLELRSLVNCGNQ